MKLLILDFLRRWRWLFIIALLLSAGGSIAGFPFVFAPAAVVALLLDSQRGVFRAVRPLPITRPGQAKAWWFVGVPLLPLLSVPVIAIGVLIFQTFNPTGSTTPLKPAFRPQVEVREERKPAPFPPATRAPLPDRRFIAPPPPREQAPAPWFAAGVQTWVALGYAGFCFFLMQWAPTRPPENIAENVQQGIFGALWGISMPGVALLLPHLPSTPDSIVPWHRALFVAVPFFVALSYLSAADVVQRRMFATVVKAGPKADSDAGTIRGGLTGVPLYVLNFAGRVATFVVLIGAIQIILFRWMEGGKLHTNDPATMIQVGMVGLMMGPLLTESIGMRALRALPLSTARLALLLSLIPWAAGLSAAAITVLWCGQGDPALPPLLNFGGHSLAMCGWGTLALALVLHMSSGGRLFLLVGLGGISTACLLFFSTRTSLLAAIGVVSGAAGFALLVRGIRKSSAFYRPRGFFGMTPGQPSAVR